jgi:protein TonB
MDADRSLLPVVPRAQVDPGPGAAEWPGGALPQERPATPDGATARQSRMAIAFAVTAHLIAFAAFWPMVQAIPVALPPSVDQAIDVDVVEAIAEPEKSAAPADMAVRVTPQETVAALPEQPVPSGDDPTRPPVEEPAQTTQAPQLPPAPENPPPDQSAPEALERTRPRPEKPAASAPPARRAAPQPKAPSQDRAERPGTDARQQTATYAAVVAAHLRRHHTYPRDALAGATSGTVRVRFSLTREGSVTSAAVSQASGSPALNSAALSTVRRASPFPRPPAVLTQLTFVVPLRFETRRE